jgi:hypothetical protein
MPQATLSTRFSVIGSNTVRKLFPKEYPLPRPGQWIFVSSARQGIATFLAQITSVSISTIDGIPDLYDVSIDLNRIAPKEEILFARLARRQFDLTEREGDALEPLIFTETVSREEEFNHATTTPEPSYSNVNYSGDEYSGQ